MSAEAEISPLTQKVIGLAIEVQRELGPGLLESAYEECFCYEFKLANVRFASQIPLPIRYKTVQLDCGYRLDVVVENRVIIELKTVERILPIHEAQMLTYLKLSGTKLGLLMNFNSVVLKGGLKRLVLRL